MGRKSIKQRLDRASTLAVKKEIIADWIKNWEGDQTDLVHQLEKAVSQDDYDQLCIVTGQLKAVTEKRFAGLVSVLASITVEND